MLEVVKKPKRTEQIKAYVTPEEFTLIMESSDRAGLSMSEFARRVCLGFRVESREDQQARRELLKVPKLGPKAFEQCAGFLRVPGAKNPLDATAVHPESYGAAEKLLALCGH